MIYQKVKEACGDAGISITALENKLNFPRSSIYKWDDNIPSVLKVYEVAKELNKPVEFFLEEDKEVKTE